MVDVKLQQFVIKRHATKTWDRETQKKGSRLQFINACNNKKVTVTRLHNWHEVRYCVRNTEQHK